jgi:hypothetical protein
MRKTSIGIRAADFLLQGCEGDSLPGEIAKRGEVGGNN